MATPKVRVHDDAQDTHIRATPTVGRPRTIRRVDIGTVHAIEITAGDDCAYHPDSMNNGELFRGRPASRKPTLPCSTGARLFRHRPSWPEARREAVGSPRQSLRSRGSLNAEWPFPTLRVTPTVTPQALRRAS